MDPVRSAPCVLIHSVARGAIGFLGGCVLGRVISAPMLPTGIIFGVSMFASKLFTGLLVNAQDSYGFSNNQFRVAYVCGHLVITGAALAAFISFGVFGEVGLGIYTVISVVAIITGKK